MTRCFGCGKENSADILYQKVLQYSLLHHNEVIALEVSQNDVKYLYFKRNILKIVLPNTFSL